VALAVGVLIVPYRPALLTAKWLASIQDLSGGRLILGVGVGWMEKEFRALGLDPRRRGATTDATLAFIHACFAGDEVEANGQTFLFRPRPPRPPIIAGGAPPHAMRRAVRFGEGWIATGAHSQVLAAGIASLREGMAAAGKPAPEVVLLQPLPVEDDERLASRLGELAALGVTRVVHPWRYRNAEEVARVTARLVAARDANAPSA
jgi:alkanesulfonate monooxygenase SsuD/methylene tetrahydromethanopterin reductase-like flavin-dependent oxidoreductase (luciferase family)